MDTNKSKAQLIAELKQLRLQLSSVQKSDGQKQAASQTEKALWESKEKYKTIVDESPIGIFNYDLEGHITECNKKFVEIIGSSREKLIGLNILSQIKDKKIIRCGIQSLKKGHAYFEGLYSSVTAKKKTYVRILFKGIRDNDDKIIAGLALVEDISKRKQAEEKLQDREEQFNAFTNQSSEGISVADLKGNYIFVNPAFCQMVGWSEEELLKMTVFDVTADQADTSTFKRTKTVEEGVPVTVVLIRKDRTEFVAEVTGKIISIRGKKCVLGSVRDITERVAAKKKLQESEQQYRALFEESPIPLWEEDFSFVKEKLDLLRESGVTDFRKYFDENPDAVIEYANLVKIIEVNKAVLALHEASSKDTLLHGLEKIFTKESFIPFKEELIAIAEGNSHSIFEGTVKTLKGESRYIELNWAVLPGHEKTMKRVYISTIDITGRKATEKALRESENKYKILFEHTADAILIIEEGKFVDCNPATIKMLGYKNKKDFLETHPSELSPEQQPDGQNSLEKANKMMALAFENGSHRFEWDHKRADGEVFPVEVLLTAIPLGEKSFLHVVWRDITKRKEAEEEKNKLETQLRRSQKLETIGTLAGGIAHDFNNILTPIMGYADMTLLELAEGDPLKRNISRIVEGAHRAKDLVEQILLFSKQVERERIPLYMHIILKEALQLLRSSIPSTVEIVQQIDSSCPKILADATQVHQVIINLCTNAWQAMEKNGGVLSIELIQQEVDANMAKMHPNLNVANYVRLTVRDTGEGMDTNTIDRIFEPFFTTKAVDKGTGLGLAVVYGIVQSHQGEILVYSEPGKGSVFHVYFPVDTSGAAPHEDLQLNISGGDESILVVDDDNLVGNMLKQMLEKFGYTVSLFNNSSDALANFKKYPHRYDLLLSDLTMPDLTGIDLSKSVHKIQSDIPIIMMTGYGKKLLGIDQESFGIKKIIEKPVIMKELAYAIREVLEMAVHKSKIK